MTEATLRTTAAGTPHVHAATGDAFDRMADALRRAVADRDTAGRLTRAETTATLREEHGQRSVTLVLQGQAAELREPGAADAEIDLVLPAAAIDDWIGGRVPLSLVLARRGLTYAGPVRKLLRIDPILRRHLA